MLYSVIKETHSSRDSKRGTPFGNWLVASSLLVFIGWVRMECKEWLPPETNVVGTAWAVYVAVVLPPKAVDFDLYSSVLDS